MSTSLTIISVCFNSGSLFASPCWRDFLRETRHKVIIVNNDSPDGSARLVRSLYPSCRLIEAEFNLGYGRAANAGLEQCETPFALLLNPDISVSGGKVEQLLATASRSSGKTAIWAPSIDSKFSGQATPVKVETIHGAAMLFDMAKMQQVGYFDENIFLYFEESDLCRRVIGHGYDLLLCPAIDLPHRGGASSGKDLGIAYMKSWHFGWSRCYYFNKHDLCTLKRNPERFYIEYFLRSYISLNRIKRRRYRGQAAGVRAYIRGEKAFCLDGSPQAAPQSAEVTSSSKHQ